MHKEIRNDRECTFYDSLEEVNKYANTSRAYCCYCGEKLTYYSFYDSKDRLTFHEYCPSCHHCTGIQQKPESYEKAELKRWRKRVLEKAEYRCEYSSPLCSGRLHAHHIIPKEKDEYLKYRTSNGVCVCEAHHKMIHSFM